MHIKTLHQITNLKDIEIKLNNLWTENDNTFVHNSQT